DQTWVCVRSSFSSELAPGRTAGCGDAVPDDQVRASCVLTPQSTAQPVALTNCARADKTAQCEAYRQVISSLQAQLRAA
ncbi:hypothetical protein N311_06433, partial [Apaloderma vittatum]